MKIVSGDVTYAVEIAGNGEPIVCLHGFTGNRDTWDFLVPMLQDRYSLIMVDIIGHGETMAPDDFQRYGMEQVAKDLKLILEKLKLRKAHILGYSMGGRLALAFYLLVSRVCTYIDAGKLLSGSKDRRGARTPQGKRCEACQANS